MKILVLSFLIYLAGCASTKYAPSQVAELAALPPMAAMIAADQPGRYGNWWRKVPLDNEKKYFSKSHSGAVAPDVKFKKNDFIGWHGIILSCENSDSLGFGLVLDHRHAGYHNVMFGVRDSSSVYSVSLFGEGGFKAVHTVKNQSSACPNNWLPGDLIKVYGKRIANRKVSIHFIRHWPRNTFELSPEIPQRHEGKYIYENMKEEQWVKLSYNETVKSRRMMIDEKIKNSLVPFLKSDNEKIRALAIYNFGEVGRPEDESFLRKAIGLNPTEKIRKVSEFALKRLNQESGPWWNIEKPKPYWGQ